MSQKSRCSTKGAVECSPMSPGVARKPLENKENRSVVQPPAVGELVPPARFELTSGETSGLLDPLEDNGYRSGAT